MRLARHIKLAVEDDDEPNHLLNVTDGINMRVWV